MSTEQGTAPPETEVLDGVAVEDHLPVLASAAPSPTLFRTDDPAVAAQRMVDVAGALAPIIEAKGLFSNIQGKKYVKVEGWLTLAAFVGVTPVTTWTRKLDNGWEARCEVRTLDGRTIGAAEAECLTTENRWGKADDYAVRSMAQTRATSKSLRSVLAFIVALAGYEPTPAEEVPAEGFRRGRAPAAPVANADGEPVVDKERVDALYALFKQSKAPADELKLALLPYGIEGVRSARAGLALLTDEQADQLEAALAKRVAKVTP